MPEEPKTAPTEDAPKAPPKKRLTTRPKLVVRNATTKDIKEIVVLSAKVYTPPYAADVLRGQINNYSEGVFVAVYEDKIIGYAATIRVTERKAMRKHTWAEITANGYCSTHNPRGEWLYGVEVMVDPDYRGLKIGERMYRERKNLCLHLRLKGIVFAGRLPLLARRLKRAGSVEKYLEMVQNKKIKDPVIGFQLRQGFEVVGVLEGYIPEDLESLGYAAQMIWRNPEIESTEELSGQLSGLVPKTVRVATVQYQQRSIGSWEEFEEIVTYFVDVVSDYHSDFVLFPELFTLQLLSISNKAVAPEEAIDTLTEYTKPLQELFHRLAIKHNVNIVGGSHPTKMQDGSIQNICFIALRDGSMHRQPKIHPTPDERYWWNIKGGSKLSVIDTDCGPIGVLICYDVEFPELARHLMDQGCNIVFVPFCTDERQGYLRVRYSAQARAVENQCYVVMAGNVGNLPRVHNMDIQYAQSCILTPCDFYFARDGIAADTTPNVEQVAFADLRLDSLFEARHSGTVLNMRDRRHDLYSVVWHKQKNPRETGPAT
jgi:predicted amidohydrolase/ribosomal protein S18 acetylase RimI-like enzyme